MNMYIQKLLGEKPAEVYCAALELGVTTVAQIAKKASLPRSTCYLILENLQKKGLINTMQNNKKTMIIAESPNQLTTYAQNEKMILEQTLQSLQHEQKELSAIYNNAPHKPIVRYYEGFNGVKLILEETLEAKEIFVLCSGYNTPIESKLLSYLEIYFNEVAERNISTKEILGPAPDTKEYQKKYSDKNHKILLADLGNNVQHIDKLIFKDKLAIISYEYLNGVVIKNKQIVDFEKQLFMRLWEKNSIPQRCKLD